VDKPELFPNTDWSLVLRASGRKDDAAGAALDSLCSRYWQPLYVFVRAQGKSKEDTEDIVQGFFAKLLRNENLKSTDESRGRLRSFLLASMRNYLISDLQKQTATKRGSGKLPLDLESAEASLPSDSKRNPKEQFEYSWALSVLAAVHQALAEEYHKKDQGDLFDALSPYVTPTGDELPYSELSEKLDVAVGTIKVRIFRLRNRYRERLREEIASGLDCPDEIDNELLHIRQVLS